MRPCPDANVLARLADGALDDRARHDVEVHLDACGVCARTLSELGTLVAGRRSPPGYRVLAPTPWGVRAERFDETIIELRFARDPAAAAAMECWHASAHEDLEAVVDFGRFDGEAYIAVPSTTYVSARSWSQAHARDERFALWCRAADIMTSVHGVGLVHGSLSPDTIAVEPSLRLVGLGAPPVHPAYVAPEGAFSARADQFALAVSLWEMLAGSRPHAGATRGALTVSRQFPLDLPGEQRKLFVALRRALSNDPAARWADVAALRAAVAT